MVTEKTKKLLAVDPSLTQSGWALFYVNKSTPISWGVIKPENPKASLSVRLSSIFDSVRILHQEHSLEEGDILVCEGPAPITLNPSSSIKVEQVRCIFENIARERKLIVPGRINPRTIHTELLGLKGRQAKREIVKEVARSVVKTLLTSDRIYREDIPQDAVDAILIGILATSRAIRANSIGSKIEVMFEPNLYATSGAKMQGAQYGSQKKGRGLRW